MRKTVQPQSRKVQQSTHAVVRVHSNGTQNTRQEKRRERESEGTVGSEFEEGPSSAVCCAEDAALMQSI